jgi:hypothetical protein
MIHVLALITAKPGMRERILEAFRANTDAVRAEAGCLAYERSSTSTIRRRRTRPSAPTPSSSSSDGRLRKRCRRTPCRRT